MLATPRKVDANVLRVGIVGGSIGGLTTALLLRALGHDVDVFERATGELTGFGAGIVAHEASVRYFAERTTIPLDNMTVPVQWHPQDSTSCRRGISRTIPGLSDGMWRRLSILTGDGRVTDRYIGFQFVPTSCTHILYPHPSGRLCFMIFSYGHRAARPALPPDVPHAHARW